MSDRPARLSRKDPRLFRPITTRWADDDACGPVNDAVRYRFFHASKSASAQQAASHKAA
jgi:acyl-CoA thioester hydrolase